MQIHLAAGAQGILRREPNLPGQTAVAHAPSLVFRLVQAVLDGGFDGAVEGVGSGVSPLISRTLLEVMRGSDECVC